MPRAFRFPAYPKKAHPSGQARIRIRGQDHYLGVWGSPASRKEYARLAAELAGDGVELPREDGAALTVADVIAAWALAHPGDKQERREILRAAAVLDRVCGPTLAKDFDADRLERVRAEMTSGSWMTVREKWKRRSRQQPIGWCQSNANHAINRIRHVFRWAERKKLVPRGAWEHLRTLEPLGRNSNVRRTAKRKPADEKSLEAVIGHLSPMVVAMVEIHTLTGMRPGELVRMRANEVDRHGPAGTWLYRLDPEDHKTGHIDGEESVVVFGAQARKILAPWIEAAERAGAATAIWRPCPAKSAHYSPAGYYRAVIRACDRAGVKRFTPYQLRHLVKLRVTRAYGSDAARAVLRQKSLEATNHYAAQQDLETAARVANEIG